jgi:hypothetical protein
LEPHRLCSREAILEANLKIDCCRRDATGAEVEINTIPGYLTAQ